MLVVNGRFLANRYPLGVHRAARSLLDALRTRGVPMEVIAPGGTTDERADRSVWSPPGVTGLQAWEQLALPLAARRRPTLSLANTGPFLAQRHAMFVFDASPILRPEWFSRFFTTYMQAMLRVARRADLVFAPSAQVRCDLVQTGVASARIEVVPLAVDEIFRPPSADDVARVRQRYRLSRPYLIHLGWGDPRKDVATAVAVHKSLLPDLPHDLVLVGGANPYFAPVSVEESTSIRKLGRVSDADLVPLIGGARALLYPSLYEGFGLPPLEAVACGTPAVVSDIEVLRETVGTRASYASPRDLSQWTDVARHALDGNLQPGAPASWRWDDAARVLRDALVDRGLL